MESGTKVLEEQMGSEEQSAEGCHNFSAFFFFFPIAQLAEKGD